MNRDDLFLVRTYRRNLLPIMLSVLGGTVNALLDSILVSQIIGADAMAAVNLCMPVYLFFCTAGALIAGGTSTLATQRIGKSELKKAAEHYHEAHWLCLIVGLALTVPGVILSRPIGTLLAQGTDLSEYVYPYLLVTFIGTGAFMMLYIPCAFLQLDGKTRAISVLFGIMIAVDVGLDLLFMLVLPFGTGGAAAASVISTAVAAVYGFHALHHGYSNFPRGMKKPESLGSIFKYGSPAALGNLFDACKLLLINIVILGAYPQHAAAWAAVNTLCEISLIIITGIPRAGFPMVCAYNTARENSGIRILIRTEIRNGLLCSGIFALLLTALYIPVGLLFNLTDSMLIPCACVGLSTVLYTLCSIWENYFHAVSRIRIANLLSAARKLVFPVVTVVVLAAMQGIFWLFLPISGILTLACGTAATWIPYRKKRNTEHFLSRILLLDDYLERNHKVLDFSIKPDQAAICGAADQIRAFCAENNMKSKMAMRLGLSIEEMLNVIIARNSGLLSIDLRAYAMAGTAGLRIRYAGKNYNPFADTEDEDFSMGIMMLNKMAEITNHTFTLGMNVVNIIFPME